MKCWTTRTWWTKLMSIVNLLIVSTGKLMVNTIYLFLTTLCGMCHSYHDYINIPYRFLKCPLISPPQIYHWVSGVFYSLLCQGTVGSLEVTCTRLCWCTWLVPCPQHFHFWNLCLKWHYWYILLYSEKAEFWESFNFLSHYKNNKNCRFYMFKCHFKLVA